VAAADKLFCEAERRGLWGSVGRACLVFFISIPASSPGLPALARPRQLYGEDALAEARGEARHPSHNQRLVENAVGGGRP